MKRKEHLFVLVLVVLFTTAGTAAGQPFPTPPPATNFVVVLSGDEQVSPVDTMARGQDIFQLNMDMADTQLSHRLIVASIPLVRSGGAPGFFVGLAAGATGGSDRHLSR